MSMTVYSRRWGSDMDKVSNAKCREYVQQRKPFRGSNLWGEWVVGLTPLAPSRYVVYSYGQHFPLFVYTHDCWFENEDKYSVSTSKHRTQSHPLCPTVLLSTHWMRTLADWGYEAIAKKRILGKDVPQTTHYEADQYAEVTNG